MCVCVCLLFFFFAFFLFFSWSGLGCQLVGRGSAEGLGFSVSGLLGAEAVG